MNANDANGKEKEFYHEEHEGHEGAMGFGIVDWRQLTLET